MSLVIKLTNSSGTKVTVSTEHFLAALKNADEVNNSIMIEGIVYQLDTVEFFGSVNVKGSIDCSGNPNYPAAVSGDAYRVSVAGKIGGGAGPVVEVGDRIAAWDTTVGGTHAEVGSVWTVEQANLEKATTSEALTGTDSAKFVTPAGLVVSAAGFSATWAALGALAGAGTLQKGKLYSISDADEEIVLEAETASSFRLKSTLNAKNADWQDAGNYAGVEALTGVAPGARLGVYQTIRGTLNFTALTKLIPYQDLTGTFQLAETVTGGTSGATGIVVKDDDSVIYLRAVVGVFQDAETITGGTSGATAVLTSVAKDYEFAPGATVTGGTSGATGIVSDCTANSVSLYSITGTFQDAEALTTTSGFGVASATASGVVAYSFDPAVGEIVIYNNTHYQKIAATDKFTVPSGNADYQALPRTGTNMGYISETDEIEFDFANNFIQRRKDKRGNDIAYSKVTDDNFWAIGNGVALFKWGSDTDYGNVAREGYIDNRNCRGAIFLNDLAAGSRISGNFMAGSTVVSLNKLEPGAEFSDNKILQGADVNNNTLRPNSALRLNVFALNSEFQSNEIGTSVSVVTNLFDNAALINGNNFKGGMTLKIVDPSVEILDTDFALVLNVAEVLRSNISSKKYDKGFSNIEADALTIEFSTPQLDLLAKNSYRGQFIVTGTGAETLDEILNPPTGFTFTIKPQTGETLTVLDATDVGASGTANIKIATLSGAMTTSETLDGAKGDYAECTSDGTTVFVTLYQFA